MLFQRDIHHALRDHLTAKQVTVLTGMRRTGKTTLVRQLLAEAPSANTLYLDLERLDNRELLAMKNYEAVLQAFAQRGLSIQQKMYVALDEMQHVPQAPSLIKYLYDNHDIKFIVTGSSSYYLKNLFTESLAGRKKIFELWPLDFGEFLTFKQIPFQPVQFFQQRFDAAEYARLTGYYEEFINYGGFPEVVLASSASAKRDLAADIISSYINIDVKTLSDIRQADALVNLMRLLAARVGNKLDYNKISRLTGLSRPTVKSYVLFLEKTYILHRLPVFARRPDREIVKAQKVYFADNGLLNTLTQVHSGALFENSVFNQLRHHGQVAYYSKKTGDEIDFIVNKTHALEVKESPTQDDATRLFRLAAGVGLHNRHLIGRYLAPTFHDFIWGGQIR